MKLLSQGERNLLARQGDVYNTAMSGTAQMLVDSKLEPGFLIINVKVPAIPRKNVNIILDKYILNIFSSIDEQNEITGQHNFTFPLNYYSINLPRSADFDHIEARWGNKGELEIIVPLRPNHYFNIPKKIHIKRRL